MTLRFLLRLACMPPTLGLRSEAEEFKQRACFLCSLFSVLCSLFSVPCSLFSVHSSLFTLHFPNPAV